MNVEPPKELEEHRWTKKQQEDFTTNGKAEHHSLSILPMLKINRIGTYNSMKELGEKFIALHEGTLEAKLARQDLLRSQLT